MHQDKKVTKKKDVVTTGANRTLSEYSAKEFSTYRDIVEQSDALMFSHDLTGKLLTINPAAESNLGYKSGELTNEFLISLVPDEHRFEFEQQYLAKIRNDHHASGIMHIKSRSGKIRHWLFHSNIFGEVDSKPVVICFAQDISDRIEMEDALQLSNETFRSAFDHSGIGIALIDPKGHFLDANGALSKFTGFSKKELLKMNFLQLTHPEDNAADQNLLHKMLIKVISHYSIEKRYISKDKKILWAFHTVSKVANVDGTPKFFILQTVDITKKKELADELNRKNSELEATRRNLVSKIGQLEELNYIIAHNLRGPANNIKMLTEMLKHKDEPAKDGSFKLEMDEIVGFLDDGANALLSCLNTLMEMVQLTMNKSIPFDDCNAGNIVNEILSQLNSTIYEKGAVIKTDLKVNIIRYPKVFLESIFYNLISNALKYSSPERTPEIIITSKVENGRTIVSVKDNGLGINLDKHGKKIFKLNQVFHPGHDSKGVGLFITKAQIESYGGTITVESEEDMGSEFIVTL